MGKPLAEAVGKIEKCALNCRFYADQSSAFLADEEVASNASHSAIVHASLGVVLAIMPWK